MLIVDGHLDLAWNACQWGRDLLRSVDAIRQSEHGLEGRAWGAGTVALPELRAGRVAVAIASVLARSTGTPEARLDYRTVAEAGVVARDQIAWYRAREHDGHLVVLETADALHRHMESWHSWELEPDPVPPRLGVVLSLEGADPVAEPDELSVWHGAGVRIVGLSHYGTGRYAGGTGSECGLTGLGRELLARVGEHRMALDVTHLTDPGVAEALDLHPGPVLASHSNARALVPHDRQLTDAQILAVAERGGVVGVALDCWMLDPAWVRGQTGNTVLLINAVDHIDHVCQLTGSIAHVGIGSDLDGGFGREQSPRDLDTIADLQLIAGHLADRGYGAADVAAVMHGNWLRLLGRCLP